MSREEAEAEDSKKKSDDMRLQMAIAKSKEDNDTQVGEDILTIITINIQHPDD